MSDEPCTSRYKKLIDRGFVGELAADRWKDLAAHLEACDACRAYHDRLGLIDRAMSKSGMSINVRERIAEQILPGPEPKKWFRSYVPVLSAAAVTIVLVALPLVDRDTFQPRGDRIELEGRPPGVMLFCIAPPSDELPSARVEGTARAAAAPHPAPVLTCTLDREIQIAYSTPSDQEMFLVVRGEGADGAVYWYAPLEGEKPALGLRRDAEGVPVEWSTRLAVHHVPGTVRITARFYRAPVIANRALSEDAVAELSATLVIEAGALGR